MPNKAMPSNAIPNNAMLDRQSSAAASILCGFAAIGSSVALCDTALAREGTQRMPSFQVRASQEPARLDGRGAMLAVIGRLPDNEEVARANRRAVPFDAADIGLSIELTQLSVRLQPGESRDAYRFRQFHLDARLPFVRDIDLMVTGDAAYMNRRVLTVPATGGRSRVIAARAGVGIAGESWSLAARYETLGTRTRRRQMHRMAEILGGAPLNRESLALVASARRDLGGERGIEVSLVGQLVRRTSADLAIIGASGTHRRSPGAEVAVSWIF